MNFLTKYIDSERLIHSLKTAIACMIGFTLIHILGPLGNQWIVISIIVVMCSQIYVGSVLQKSYLRALGTLIGCLISALILVTMGYDESVIALVLGLSGFIFSYLGTSQESLSYMGTLGAVTVAIVLLDKHPTVLLAFQRFIEICVGIFIAALVSQFVLPIHARAHLRRTQAKTLKSLMNYYHHVIIQNNLAVPNPREREEEIIKSILKQRQLAKESKRERAKLLFNLEYFDQSLLCEREILRAMVFMHYAKEALVKMQSTFLSLPQLINYHEKNMQALDILIKVIEDSELINQTIYPPSFNGLQNNLHEHYEYSQAEQHYIQVFLFSANIFTSNLVELAKLYNIEAIS